MSTIVMEDDLLPEGLKLKISYRGKNPFSAYKRVKEIVSSSVQITSASYWERDFRWDITGDPRKFYIRVYAKKGLDTRSHLMFEIILQGSQPKDPEKEGEVYIQLRGKLVTQYKLSSGIQNTAIYKNLLRLYNLLFYWKIRRRYLSLGKAFLLEIYDSLKSSLGISIEESK